jgi:enoyl-CoA hydratase/carnithine racemase
MDDLQFDVEEGIGIVTFNRPQARNALTFAMYDELERICGEIDRTVVKTMIIRGAGTQAFAAGTDIAQFLEFSSAEDAIAYEKRLDRVLAAVERCQVPTIAAIAGACTGGGAAIAAACDLRIGASNLQFGFPIARTLGNCLSMANYARLTRLLGGARVRDIIYTARLIDADEARTCGLVREVVTPEELRARAMALASTVARHAPLTLWATKQSLLRLEADERPVGNDDLVAACYTSSDFAEGVRAFLARRSPEWKGQ